MKKIAILGFGKVGKALWDSIQTDAVWQRNFQVTHLWNRSATIFEGEAIPDTTVVCKTIEEMLAHIEEIDLVVECAHSEVIRQYGTTLLKHTDVLVFSPTAFSDAAFRNSMQEVLKSSNHQCYLPLGASVAIWDIIRLEQTKQLKQLKVSMTKPPQSFRIQDEEANKRLQQAAEDSELTEIVIDKVSVINTIAPQNTNTMAIYALAASSLGFEQCIGSIYAQPSLEAHIVKCEVETTIGMTYHFERCNPANIGAVTGTATFASFLNSVFHHEQGIRHNNLVFC